MNNNMPNNFNNGMPNNNPVNGGLNPQQQAKEQLVGGQSAVGNGPSVMQGQPNVQNDRGVMQGMANVPNTPGVMQGNAMPNKPEVPPVMPGQNHSGINAVTMQKEEVKKDEPGVVSIPNFDAAAPEPPKPAQPNPAQGPKPTPMNNMNQSMNNNPMNQINTPNIGPSVNEIKPVEPVKPEPINDNVGINSMNQVGANPSNNSVMQNEPVEQKKPLSDNVIGNNSINQAPNPMEQVNNQNLNNFPFENINQMNEPKPQSTMGSTMNNQNVIGNAPKDLNDPLTGGANNNLNRGMSQVGVTQMNNSENDVVEMPETPTKKFPLSTREMILIGVALVGIIAVVIMYWPK